MVIEIRLNLTCRPPKIKIVFAQILLGEPSPGGPLLKSDYAQAGYQTGLSITGLC